MKKLVFLVIFLAFLFYLFSLRENQVHTIEQKVVQSVHMETDVGIFSRVANSIDSGMSAKGLWVTAQLESSGNPNARNGSHVGLINMGEEEFRIYGPPFGLREDPLHNLMAAAHYAKANVRPLSGVLKRKPKEAEIYLSLQQGRKGAIDLFSHPKARAIDVRTRSAILGNVPDGLKKQAEKWTCEQFVRFWVERFENEMKREV